MRHLRSAEQSFSSALDVSFFVSFNPFVCLVLSVIFGVMMPGIILSLDLGALGGVIGAHLSFIKMLNTFGLLWVVFAVAQRA